MKFKTFLIAVYKAFISPSKPKKSYSQYAEDLIIQSYFSGKLKNGQYVDVGCHHPRRGSNTYGLYRKGWSGILIDLEKSKVLANQLSRRRDKIILAAVSDAEEWMEIFLINLIQQTQPLRDKIIKMGNHLYKKLEGSIGS